MRTRIYDWFNAITSKPQYGFQYYDEKRKMWLCAMKNQKLLLFKTKKERDAERKNWRKLKEYCDEDARF